MAHPPGPLAKQPPQILEQSDDKRSPPALAAVNRDSESCAWPSQIPALAQSLRIATGAEAPPPQFDALTTAFLSSLSFSETAALHDAASGGDAASLCKVVAIRWRLAAALDLRPITDEPPDGAALEQLLAEIDDGLATINQLKRSDDPDLREACDAARAALAKGVHKLLPTTVPEMGSTTEEVKELRKVLAAAAKSSPKARSQFRASAANKKTWGFLLVGILALSAGAYTTWKSLHEEQLPRVPTLPQPPENTEVIGDPSSGTVIVRSTNGQPIDPEALERYKSQAIQNGATVQKLAPTQLLITSGSRSR